MALTTPSLSPTSPPHPYIYYDSNARTEFTSDYEPQEPEFDDEEAEFNPQDPDDPEHATSTAAQTPAAGGAATDDPDAQAPLTNGAQTPTANIVEVNTGDGPKRGGVLGLKEKRIENDERSTTPYMTKYERARVLGTRALQIRYVRYDEGLSVC